MQGTILYICIKNNAISKNFQVRAKIVSSRSPPPLHTYRIPDQASQEPSIVGKKLQGGPVFLPPPPQATERETQTAGMKPFSSLLLKSPLSCAHEALPTLSPAPRSGVFAKESATKKQAVPCLSVCLSVCLKIVSGLTIKIKSLSRLSSPGTPRPPTNIIGERRRKRKSPSHFVTPQTAERPAETRQTPPGPAAPLNQHGAAGDPSGGQPPFLRDYYMLPRWKNQPFSPLFFHISAFFRHRPKKGCPAGSAGHPFKTPSPAPPPQRTGAPRRM